MITYVYFKESKIIIAKIDNIEYISDNEKEIRGNSTIKYGGSQDYICLETDSINLNIGDIISLDGLIDHRTYFTKGKEVWLQEKLQKANEKIIQLELSHEELKAKGEKLQCFSLDLQYQIDIK